jgi:hypothetical protein
MDIKMNSTALIELKKMLEQSNLLSKSGSYIDGSIESFYQCFAKVPDSDYEPLLNWLNAGSRLADKINNFIFYYLQFDTEVDEDIGMILPDDKMDIEWETIQWLEESFNECTGHYEECQAPVEIFVAGYIEKDQGQTVIRYRIIGVDSRQMIGPMLWDEIAVSTNNPLGNSFYAFLTLSGCAGVVFYDGPPTDTPKSISPAPLFKYHPVRYSQTRDYVKQLPEALRTAGITSHGVTIDALNYVAQVVAMEINNKNSKSSLRYRRNKKIEGMSAIEKEMDCYQMYSGFVQSGKKIFDLNPPLVEMLRDTSVDAIPVSFITSPFPAYYLYFGKQDHLQITTGWHIDGVYIQHRPEEKQIEFWFTSCADKLEDVQRWHETPEPSLVCVISDKQFELNLGKAIDSVIALRREELLERIAEGDQDRTEELKSAAIEAGQNFDSMGVGMLIDIGATSSQYRLDKLDSSVATLKGALSLAVNSMCYLTAYPDDIDLDWASETPRAMVEKATKGHPNVKKNTESKLLSTGYQKVYLCGRKVSQGPIVEADGVNGKKRTHWRRFHWRLQPYGPKRALRKAIIIEATLINPGAGFEDEPTGTIYIDRNVVDMASVKKKLKITSAKYWEGVDDE